MILKSKPMRILKCMANRINDDEVQALGAQLTYYLILSFFPFLIFLLSIVSYMHLSASEVMANLYELLPDEAAKIVVGIVEEVTTTRTGTLLSVGMLAAIWAASNGINAVIKGLNKAYDEEESRPFWKVRGISILATLVLAIVILVTMLTLIFGRAIGQYLLSLTAFPADFEQLWHIVQYVIPITVMTAVFMLLYWIAPNRKLRLREVIPGAVFTTLGWIGTSILFSFYVNHFGAYSRTYGSLGGVIVLLIWLYISSMIILLGGELNATLTFEREGKVKPECKSFGLQLPFFKRKTK